ncbi:WD repeat-containing protein JIP5 [Cryptococcus decagattii]|uniref:WD repeat-containing protein n=1 Tax=Cryptococcus decagattii TaxID=1859122 RepID=A0ABZ2AU97_9TREE
MPDIKLKNQPFDVAFHPKEPVVFSSLLTGQVCAWSYDDATGETSSSWSKVETKFGWEVKVEVFSSFQLVMDPWQGKGTVLMSRFIFPFNSLLSVRCPINRVYCVNRNLVASGDDDGVIKLWDPRQADSIRTYSQHFDYITDFTYFDDKRQLVATSGDGHLSVIDIRSNKSTPLTVSEDQEDELLSIVPIKGGQKAIVGSGLGILSVWNRQLGWADSVDRIPGHPASIDAIVALTPDIIATGSEDGMIRVIQVLPHKFLGVVATHEEFPVERIRLDRNNKWLGSVSHDECLKLTDVEDLFEDSDEDDDMEEDEPDSDEEKSKKKKKDNGMKDMGRSQADDEGSFFADL